MGERGEDKNVDFDAMVKRSAMEEHQDMHTKNNDESAARILQRLKDPAMNLYETDA